MPTSQPIFDYYGKLIAFVDGRTIVSSIACDRDASPLVARGPVGGCPPVAADRLLLDLVHDGVEPAAPSVRSPTAMVGVDT